MNESLLPCDQKGQRQYLEMNDFGETSSSRLTPIKTNSHQRLSFNSSEKDSLRSKWKKYIFPALTLLFVFAPGIIVLLSKDIRILLTNFGEYLSQLRPSLGTTAAFWIIGFIISLFA